MELMRFGKYHEPEDCPICRGSLWNYCETCGKWQENYCPHCGEDMGIIEAFLVFTTDKYHGVDKASSNTATLILGKKDYASAHIDKTEDGIDIAYLQLGFIPQEYRTEKTAQIISDFAKFVKYDWNNSDKNSDLPILVRLIGFINHKRIPFPNNMELFIALQNATEIKTEHLAWEFTSE